MSQNNTPGLSHGLDIAKASLQLDLAGQSHLLANDAQGHARLLQLLRAHPGAHLGCAAEVNHPDCCSLARLLPPRN